MDLNWNDPYIKFDLTDVITVQQMYAKSLWLITTFVVHLDPHLKKCPTYVVLKFCQNCPKVCYVWLTLVSYKVSAQAGQNVTLVDVSPDVLKKAQASITTNLERVAKKIYKDKPEEGKKFVAQALARIKTSIDPLEPTRTSDLVVEAIVENLDVKHKLFKSLDEVAADHTILASNTSSLSINDICSVVKRKDKFGGLHFFNPVPVMKLLEVVRGAETSDATYEAMMEWGAAVGKTCITCKDTPGFVVNRLLVPYIAEAIRLYERGDASARDIDTAMKLGAGYPMGPLELADYVGLDTNKFILDGWHKKYPDQPLFKPIPALNKLVAEGKLGVKSGEGFYKYEKRAK